VEDRLRIVDNVDHFVECQRFMHDASPPLLTVTCQSDGTR
jgi:hypothetical protein